MKPTHFLLILGFFLISCNGKTSTDQNDPTTVTETIVPLSIEEFIMISVAGDSTRINPDNYSFINFWATWCTPCIQEMPSLEILTKELEGKMDFYYASYEKPERVKNFVEKKGFNLPFYYFEETNMPAEFQSAALPLTVILHGNEIVFKKTGSTEWTEGEVYEEIQELLEAGD